MKRNLVHFSLFHHKIMFNIQSNRSLKLKALALRSFILAFLVGFTINKDHLCSYNHSLPTPTNSHHPMPSSTFRLSMQNIPFDGSLSFDNMGNASKDFGNRYHLIPSAVLHPKSVSDISRIVKHVFDLGSSSDLTIAARGHGHSLKGQAQAYQGIVINMESLTSPVRIFFTGENPYVDVSGGELWINILHESLKHGLAPKSWTDYLHLTVGGTLSNAGISGQAFRHGPQINNVYQLQVVTGKGEVVTCSEEEEEDLFHAVLGGLGQFGIITRARIALETAPTKVKWIRALYSDFTTFTDDQEHLISSENSFDYIEGFVIINRSGLLNQWRSSFNPKDPVQANRFVSDGRILFCLEVAKYYSTQDSHRIDQDVDGLLSRLNYIQSTLLVAEVAYADFLDRVHMSEIKLREKGMWEVPHPWLNLIIPRSSIHEFAREVFNNIVKDSSNGPILIYPVNKSRWINGTSFVMPEEDVVYLVAFLSSATGKKSLESILTRNMRILDFTERSKLGIKQYLPHYTTTQEWKAHFGAHWQLFSTRKMTYDPLAILAPGQRIFSNRAKV